MHAERVILETDLKGNLKKIPKLPANKQFEVIFLVIDDATASESVKRSPHPDLVAQLGIKNNIIDSSPLTDWNLFDGNT